jgi:hypothetical protein
MPTHFLPKDAHVQTRVKKLPHQKTLVQGLKKGIDNGQGHSDPQTNPTYNRLKTELCRMIAVCAIECLVKSRAKRRTFRR